MKIRFGGKDPMEGSPKGRILYIWNPPFGYTITDTFFDENGKAISMSGYSETFGIVEIAFFLFLIFLFMCNIANIVFFIGEILL